MHTPLPLFEEQSSANNKGLPEATTPRDTDRTHAAHAHTEQSNTAVDTVPSRPFSERLRAWRTFSGIRTLEHIIGTLSPFEKTVATCAVIALLFSTALMLKALNAEITTEVPVHGGSFTEGMVGSMRFVNPVLAVSDTDRALVSLVYSGLLRSVNGTLVPDIAEKYTVSDDGRTYTFTLRSNATFHDGAPVTVDDIIYTIHLALDPGIKSPRRAEWEGVSIKKISDTELSFTLEKPFSSFLQNTTMGILPKHIWSSLTTEEFAFSTNNVRAVGSGPYMFANVTYKSDGIPSRYTLRSFPAYTLGAPYITTISCMFFANETDALSAWNDGAIDSLGGLSSEKNAALPPLTPLVRTTLPREFAVFFNPAHNAQLSEKAVRSALEKLIPRGTIVRTILLGFANPLEGPLPTDIRSQENDLVYATQKKQALEALAHAGWANNPATSILEKDGKELSVSLATANTPELKDTARTIAESWRSVGVKVKVELYEPGDLQQTVVRPRAFDTLFFGEVVSSPTDLFAFWHSSQKDDPGLNIAGYTNKDVDKLLEKMRTVRDEKEVDTIATKISKMIVNDVPAAFVYSPTYVYIPARTVQHVTVAPSMEAYERFSGVHLWYIESDRVWNFLVK